MLNNLTTKAYVTVTNAIYEFKKNQKGVTAIEYGLIAVAMAAFIVYVFYSEDNFIGKLKDKFAGLTGSVQTDPAYSPNKQ